MFDIEITLSTGEKIALRGDQAVLDGFLSAGDSTHMTELTGSTDLKEGARQWVRLSAPVRVVAVERKKDDAKTGAGPVAPGASVS